MTWNDLTKKNKLLIYMYSHECATTKTLTIASCIDDAIAYGIAKDKKALTNLFYNLRNKGLIKSGRLLNGTSGYWLTDDGKDYAEWLIDENTDLEVPNFASLPQPSKTEKARMIDIDGLVKMFADIVTQSYGAQPKQNENADASSPVKNAPDEIDNIVDKPKKTIDYGNEEEIVRLRIENADLKEQIARKQEYQQNTAAELDKKTKECEHLKNGYDRLSSALEQLCGWIDSLKRGGN